ncbi:MAG: hypothetical protein BKP49_06105 [Treponema sp. CETP13]|nr:MAG: hypothetical protein BKP49_06105 [Treponema sp. CETP13]
MEYRRFVGIDLGKRTYEVKVINPDKKVTGWNGKTTKQGRAELYSKLLTSDRVAIEACSLAMIIAKEMKKEVGCDLIVLNSSKLAVIYSSTKKNDKEDALKLARLVKIYEDEELPVVRVPTTKETQQREILTEYRQIKQDRTKEINRLHSLFVSAGYTEIVKKNLATIKNREEYIKILSGYHKEQALRILEILAILEKHIETILTQRVIRFCLIILII